MGVNFLLFLYYLLMTRVLLAEDDTSISEPLSRALRREGYEVDVTADGPSTLDKALSEGVDLILLDIGLPELDGLEVCRRVRAGGYAVPVLILTARARSSPASRSCARSGTRSGGRRPRRSTCTSPGCAASSAMTRTAPGTSPRSAAWDSALNAATDRNRPGPPARRRHA